jgi:phosphatidate cytidylyltransferase
MVRKGARSTTFNKIMFPLCVIGVSWAFGCIYYLSIVRYWTTIVILLVVVVGCDITAYFAGVLFGKHKMAPNISPKKSWEGAIIGSLVSAGLLVLFIYLFSLIPHNFDNDVRKSSMDVAYNFFGVQFENYFDNTVDKWQWWVTVSAIAITLTVVSICGDLLFSWFKRQNKIKDFGNTLQGHGGFLDRIDSLTTVILVFAVITFVISAFTVCYHGVSDGIWSVSHFFPEWH